MGRFAVDHEERTEHVPAVPEPDDGWDADEVIDQALRLVADHHRALGALIGRPTFSPTIAHLRQSPLGRDLRLLATAGDDASPAAVRAAAERVTEALLRPLAADDYAVPAWFWRTGLGRLLARAERAAQGPAGLLTPTQAAAQLGVDRRVVQGWIAEGTLAAVPDVNDRPLVSRQAIERRRLVALELARPDDRPADVLLGEQRLAS